MKKLILLTLAVFVCALMAQAAPSTIVEDNFESYAVGENVIGQNGWTTAYGTPGNDGNALVEEGGYEGGKCLHVTASGLFGIHWDIDNVGGQSAKFDYKVSMMVKRPTQKADESGEYTGDIIFGSNDGLGENHFIKKDGQFGIRFSACAPQYTVANSEPRDEWVYFSYTLNTTANGAFLRECTFGDETYEKLNIPIGNQTSPDKFRRLRFFIWGGQGHFYVDNLKCEFVDVPPTSNVTATNPGIIKFGSEDPIQSVVSATGNSATVYVNVESDGNWLSIKNSIEPYAAQINVAPGSPATVEFNANLPANVRNMPAATVTYSYYNGEEDKTFTNSILAQNGNKGLGWALYATDFDSMPLGGDVKLQPGWGETGAANVIAADPEDAENQCLKITGGGQIHTAVNMPDVIYPTYDVRVSMDMYYPEGVKPYLVFGTDLSHRMGEVSVSHPEGGIKLGGEPFQGVDVPNLAPYGQWFNVAYTFTIGLASDDTRPWVLHYAEFDGETYHFDNEYVPGAAGDNENFLQFRNYTFSASEGYYVDNFKVELIKSGTLPEPAIFGVLALLGLCFARKQR
ncbi:hypothetical protein IKZ40_02505 [bacterium]|nr:hypothetical protein [bacterium]